MPEKRETLVSYVKDYGGGVQYAIEALDGVPTLLNIVSRHIIQGKTLEFGVCIS